MHNASFLTHDFLPVMLNALGLDDKSGVIYEVVEHDYFNITDLGDWDKMMPGMINVMQFSSFSSISWCTNEPLFRLSVHFSSKQPLMNS